MFGCNPAGRGNLGPGVLAHLQVYIVMGNGQAGGGEEQHVVGSHQAAYFSVLFAFLGFHQMGAFQLLDMGSHDGAADAYIFCQFLDVHAALGQASDDLQAYRACKRLKELQVIL